MPIPTVAIACQGGGSHAAFTAGVLIRLLSPEFRGRYRLVALSGTSGGAMCAALAWRGLVADDPDEAAQRLLEFWRDVEVHDPMNFVYNFWGVALAETNVEVSPYSYSPPFEPALRELLHKHLELERLTDRKRRSQPRLLIGATDVLSGERVIFPGESLTCDELIASAAVPPLFRAAHANGHLYWDGLFSSNPPVREFTDFKPPPDEIWVIQLNPQHRCAEPSTIREIVDRRDELSGNLSLFQELYFVERINKLRELHAGMNAQYHNIHLRVVELDDQELDYASKLDRNRAFIERLLKLGRARAELFFDPGSDWPRPGTTPGRSVVRHGIRHT